MFKNYLLELFIALRYLRGHHHTTIFSPGVRLSFIFLSLMIFTMILVLTVFAGFEKEIHRLLKNSGYHITITRSDPTRPIRNYQEILSSIRSDRDLAGRLESVQPAIIANSLIELKDRFEEVKLTALPAGSENNFQNYPRLVHYNQRYLDDFFKGDYILVGRKLAREQKLRLGDHIWLIIPTGNKSTPQSQIKRTRFKIAGFFRTGFNEFDSKIFYTSLPTAQRKTGYGNQVNQIVIRLKNISALDYSRILIRDALPDNPYFYTIYTIKDERGNFLAAVKLEKTMMVIVLGLLLIAGAAGIWVTIFLLLQDKKKSIGMLAAMGLSVNSILLIFTGNAILIGLLATLIGGSLAVFVTANLQSIITLIEGYINLICQFLFEGCKPITLIPQDIYYFDYIPVSADSTIVFGVTLVTIILSGLAGYIPTRRKTGLEPILIIKAE